MEHENCLPWGEQENHEKHGLHTSVYAETDDITGQLIWGELDGDHFFLKPWRERMDPSVG